MQAVLAAEAAKARRSGGCIKRLIAGVLAVAVLATTSGARADDAALALAARDKAACAQRLKPVEDAIEKDGRYARYWTDAWLVTGLGLVALNMTGAFQVTGYRRAESLTYAATSGLLMVNLPLANSNTRTLAGLRDIQRDDPCNALINAKQIIEANQDDYDQHFGWPQLLVPIVLNIVTGAVLAVATGHWDFAANGNEGLSGLVGIAVGELQLLTWPHPSIKASATSLQVQF